MPVTQILYPGVRICLYMCCIMYARVKSHLRALISTMRHTKTYFNKKYFSKHEINAEQIVDIFAHNRERYLYMTILTLSYMMIVVSVWIYFICDVLCSHIYFKYIKTIRALHDISTILIHFYVKVRDKFCFWFMLVHLYLELGQLENVYLHWVQ